MTPNDPTASDPTAIDRDELGLSLAEHWHRRGIVVTYPDLSPDEFDEDDAIVFRAYQSAVDFVLDRLSAAGLLAAAPLPAVDRLYAHLVADRPKSASQREVSPGVVLEYDEHDRPIGVEVIGARSVEIDGKQVAAPPPSDLDLKALHEACTTYNQAWRDRGTDSTILGSLAGRIRDLLPSAPAAQPDLAEPEPLKSLPWQVARLVHAVDRMRDNWAEASEAYRAELWRGLHSRCDDVWAIADADPDAPDRTAAHSEAAADWEDVPTIAALWRELRFPHDRTDDPTPEFIAAVRAALAALRGKQK